MKRLLLLVLALLLWVVPALAENLDNEKVPPGEDVIVAVKKGAPVPFDGQLFDINTAIRWGLWLKNCRERAELAADRDKALCQTELSFQEDIAETQLHQLEVLNTDLKSRLLRSETKVGLLEYELANPDWYETQVFYFVLGAVTLGGVGLLATQVF